MKKIDATVLRETRYIAVVTFVLSVLMESVFLILGKWDISVLLGNIWGALGAVCNFLLMGITVQNALTKEEKDAKTLVKFSQTARMFFLLAFALVGHFVPLFRLIAVVIPFLFPRIAVSLRPLIIREIKD
ncbi:MAG: hypothetical protein E7413_07065 [Ruminococcaceae bacterium]|nr:hypothetical protein [Oscillospiraceae bacterium]